MRATRGGRGTLVGLPPGCEFYRSSPVFTETTVPAALLRSHRTAPGTWAVIRVLEGLLLYRVLDPPAERALDPAGVPGLIEPGVPHEVATLGPVRFQVEFYRITGAAGGVAPCSRPEGKAMARSAGPAQAAMDRGAHRADRGRVLALFWALIWAGMVLGVSFLATPAKFLAPSLPRPVALDVGRHTFRMFGRVEAALAALLGLRAAGSKRRRLFALAPGLVVLAQTLWLRPLLDARTQQVIAGRELPPSDLHLGYVAGESAKLAALLALGLTASRSRDR